MTSTKLRSTESDAPAGARVRFGPSRAQILAGLERSALPLLLLLVVLYFSIAPASAETFPTAANFRTIVSSNSVLALCALGLVVPLVAGQYDLSVAANLGVSSMVMAALLSDANAPLAVAIGAGVLTGATIGLINGVLVAWVGVNSFVTTLGMSSILSALVLLYTDGLSITAGIPTSLTEFGSSNWLGAPRVAFVLLVVALLLWRVLSYTPFGRYLHAVGSSDEAARLVGIRADLIVLLAFVLGGALCGVGGTLLVAQSSGFNPQASAGFLLPAFAAAFLGATMSAGNSFNVLGTIVAVFFVAAAVSGLTLSGVEPWVQPAFQGLALIIAVAVGTVLRRRRMGEAL